jgi:hypothetical protein
VSSQQYDLSCANDAQNPQVILIGPKGQQQQTRFDLSNLPSDYYLRVLLLEYFMHIPVKMRLEPMDADEFRLDFEAKKEAISRLEVPE